MANEEHLAILGQGMYVWNRWRERNPEIQPDLSHADLSNVDLSFAKLSFADLRLAKLIYADLSFATLIHATLIHAKLSNANLSHADLIYAKLIYAKLSNADLIYAKLSNAKLSNANLSNATLNNANLNNANLNNATLRLTNLSFANLSFANLSGANFYRSRLGYTIFAWVNLCAVERLDTVIHEGPSSVDVETMQLPEGKTLIHFLRGAGFSDTFIDYLPSLLSSTIQYGSCFISYAHQDEALAQRLYKDLQDKGVRCWYAPEDMKTGDRIRSRIDQAIHLHEKLLLLLSEHALASSWVEAEVEAALEKEKLQKCDVLFPVRLDDAVMHTSQAWATTLRRMRHIGDFTNWQDDAIYQQRFEELLRHLKVKTT